MLTIVMIAVLLVSIILHECAHGWLALYLGDDTAQRAGRLTLNPIKHLDWFGSIVLPLLLVLGHSPFLLAWAKPVPLNPYLFRDRKFGELKVALVVPAVNLILALLSGLFVRFSPLDFAVKGQMLDLVVDGQTPVLLNLLNGNWLASLTFLAGTVCLINLGLLFFNLLPIPPLDGSKLISVFLPTKWHEIWWRWESYGFILLVLLLATNALSFVFGLVFDLFMLLTGLVNI